jgi:asparagine synthase (glutamine-hydrolysing)
MSGIAGHMTARDGPLNPSLGTALAAALSHRGPDGEGRFVTGGLHLVHTRLSVAADADEQPYYLSDGAVLILDGGADHDAGGLGAETIVEAYRGDPLRFAESLSGAYAVALYDPGERSLLLARDPLGQRPLYYAEADGDLLFASEPKALIRSGAVKPALRPESAVQLLQLQFTTGRSTPFEGISRVLPGEALLARGGRVVDRRRRTPLPGLAPLRIGEAEGISRLREALGGVVQSIASRGSLGALHLKPNIGSAALVAAMIESGVKPALVVSVQAQSGRAGDGLNGLAEEFLESEYVSVDVGPAEIWRELPKMVAALDDPAADYSIIPTYFAAARAAHDVKALISDDGADEIFAGYGRYRAVTRWFWLGGRAMRSRGFLEGFGILRDETSRWRDGIVAVERRIAEEPFTKLQAAQALDSTDWLAHDVMLRLDRANAAHGIETQTPFLDETVAHFGFRLPDGLKVSGGRGAHLLRSYVASVMPKLSTVFDRQRSSWLEPWLSIYATRLVEPLSTADCIRQFCHGEAVAQLLRQCASGTNKRSLNAAWQLLFFALWHRIHIEGVSADGDALETLMAK